MSESNADNHSNLRLARSDLGGEYVPRDREAEVQDFVEQELGLDILKNFSKNKGRRRSKPPLTFEFRRDLTLDDALAMQSAPARTTGQTGGVAPLVRIRTVHHQIARMLADGTKIVNICAVLGSSTAVFEAIKYNLGVSILSRHAVQDGVEHGRIQIIDILNLAMKRPFYAVTAEKRSLPHHYQVFLRYLLS